MKVCKYTTIFDYFICPIQYNIVVYLLKYKTGCGLGDLFEESYSIPHIHCLNTLLNGLYAKKIESDPNDRVMAYNIKSVYCVYIP